ncbi:hypothetical protein ATKI12_8508 [Kitasatospora sp. Ki12]
MRDAGERDVDVLQESGFEGIDLCPWGKFCGRLNLPYPLLFHLLDTAAAALELWDRFLTPSQRKVIAEGLGVTRAQARRLVAFFAGLHDIGKLIPSFAACEPVAWAAVSDALQQDAGRYERLGHERASMHLGVHLLADLGYAAGGNNTPSVRIAQIFGGHRGRFLQLDLAGAARLSRVTAGLGGARWQDLRRRYTAQLRHLTGATAVPTRVSVPAAVLICGLTQSADRLVSRRDFWLPLAELPASGTAEHFARARTALRSAVHSMAEADTLRDAGLLRTRLADVPFARAHGHERPNDLQASLIGQLPAAAGSRGAGILVATDMPGGGKTVLALEATRILNAACGTRGWAILLPTTATTDATWALADAYVSAHQPEHAPLTLVHSHAFLNPAYNDRALAPGGARTSDGHRDDDGADGRGRPEEKVTVPDPWLRGAEQALLAQFTVATHDQALMAALPVRHSAMRMLALSGKTVVIDEAHILAPYSRILLERLLSWLGAYRTPVVLLSATMPAATTDHLVRAYLTGAGHRQAALAARSFAAPYPGWTFTDAATATVTTAHATACAAHAAAHRRDVHLAVRPVLHRRLEHTGRPTQAGERLHLVEELLAPTAEHGGCAGIACATVADAQDTYLHLKHRRPDLTRPGRESELVLLHARFPGAVREAATRRVLNALGRGGPRPERLIVVSTSGLDISFDIDFDTLVADLASIARLLQLAGRLRRFETAPGRTALARRPGRAPLTVLQPVDATGTTLVPGHWSRHEHPDLLHATAALLHTRGHTRVTMPDDVQHLVEQIHATGPIAADTGGFGHLLAGHRARTGIDEHHAARHAIPAPAYVSSLADLHRQPLTSATAATRLGAMPVRALAVHCTPGHPPTLDAAGHHPLPGTTQLRSRDVRTVLQHTFPVPPAWVTPRPAQHPAVPETWKRHALLAGVVLIPHHADATPACFGRHLLRLDGELGLVHTEQD